MIAGSGRADRSTSRGWPLSASEHSMIRRLRCLFRKHQWEPDSTSNRAKGYVCPRCGAHVTVSIGAQSQCPYANEYPGGGGGDVGLDGVAATTRECRPTTCVTGATSLPAWRNCDQNLVIEYLFE